MTRRSLRFRLALAGAVATGLAIALATAGMVALFAAHSDRRTIEGLGRQLDQVLAGLDRDADGRLIVARPPADPRLSVPYGGLYWQIEAPGLLETSRSLWDYTLPLPAGDLRDGLQHVHELSGPEGEPLLTVERSVRLPDRLGGTVLRAAAAMDRRALLAARQEFRRDLLPYAVILALVLIAAGWAQIAIGLRPLGRIRDRIGAVRTGAARRLGSDFPEEVLPLATEVDALLDAREAELEKARTRASDLAHGFKTPLQALLGEAERVRTRGLTESGAAIEDIVGTMRQHVDRELARAHVSLRARNAACAVADTVRGLVGVLGRTEAGRRIAFDIDIDADLTVAAERGDLAEALGALMENAVRHARSAVSISATTAGPAVEIVLRDDGPGIPADRTRALMARGARADARGTGFGLGIARDIVEALGGRLALADAAPGLEVRVTLPPASV